jgi:hypothetical protein
MTIADYGGQFRRLGQLQTPITVEGVAPTESAICNLQSAIEEAEGALDPERSGRVVGRAVRGNWRR